MKKAVVLIIAITLCFSCFSGCGIKGKKDFKLTAKIEEQELCNESGVVVKALYLETHEFENDYGTSMTLDLVCSIENNADCAITPKLYTISINGITTNNYTVTTMTDDAYEGATKSWLESGESATCSFTLGYVEDAENYEIALADMGITDVGYVNFDLAISNPDSDSWNDYLFIKPVQIKTSIYESYTQNPPAYEGKLIFDENGIRIYCLGLSDLDGTAPAEYNSKFWSSVDFYIENNTGETVWAEVAIERITVNGTVCEWMYGASWLSPYDYIRSGEAAFTRFKLYYLHFDDHIDVSTGTLKELKCSFVFTSEDYIPYSSNDVVLVQTPELTMNFN
jgi:hypothetical protein